MGRLTLVAVLAVASFGIAGAQAPVAEWLFDGDVEGFACTDPTAQVTSTSDENVVREEGNGVLELSYTPSRDGLQALVGQATGGLTGGHSLRGCIRTSAQTVILVGLVEADGSGYHAGFSSLPGRWQEIALDFSEFALGDDDTDENGKLDPDQVQTVVIADAVAMMATLAEQVPFLIAPDMSPRMLWLDDLRIDSEGVDPRWADVNIDGVDGVRVESFESVPLQWMCLAGPGIEITYDPEHKAHGEYSLRLAYDLPPSKLFVAATGLTGIPLAGMKVLRVSYASEVATTLLVEIEEADGSKYNTMVPIDATDTFVAIEIPLGDLELAHDSTDENGRLDMDQAKQFVVGDLSAMTNNPVTLNTLWIDDLLFLK
jgi:hypothetical protein